MFIACFLFKHNTIAGQSTMVRSGNNSPCTDRNGARWGYWEARSKGMFSELLYWQRYFFKKPFKQGSLLLSKTIITNKTANGENGNEYHCKKKKKKWLQREDALVHNVWCCEDIPQVLLKSYCVWLVTFKMSLSQYNPSFRTQQTDPRVIVLENLVPLSPTPEFLLQLEINTDSPVFCSIHLFGQSASSFCSSTGSFWRPRKKIKRWIFEPTMDFHCSHSGDWGM